jgi:hypothetical protein
VCKPTGGGKNFGFEIVIPSYSVGYTVGYSDRDTDRDTDRDIDRDTASKKCVLN